MKSENFLYDELKYYIEEEDQPTAALIIEYEGLELSQLIKQYTKVEQHTKDEETTKRLDVLRLLILRRLHIVDLNRFTFMLDELEEELAELREWVINFKNHRHKEGVTYSEKPNW